MKLLSLLAALALCRAGGAHPPRGWNSYDSSGGAVGEEELLAIASYVQRSPLARAGYTLLVIDEGWSERDGLQLIDAFGRVRPNEDLYPSARGNAGFGPLTASLQARGTSLGLWVMRGVPKAAAAAALPIWNSSFSCDQAVRFDKACAWNSLTFGTKYGLGGVGQEAAADFYASMAALFVSWNVSTVKGDCFFPKEPPGQTQPTGYYDGDLEGFTAAMAARNVSVMLSPGISVTVENASWIAAHPALGISSFRVTEDTWDLWEASPDGTFPQGIAEKLTVSRMFAPSVGGEGAAAMDLDMLPFGRIFNASAEGGVAGPARPSRLTHAEQRTAFTLYSIAKAPLILGAKLPLDAEEEAHLLPLLTNPEILGLNDYAICSESCPIPAIGDGDLYAWACRPRSCPAGALGGVCAAVALFNRADEEATVGVLLSDAFAGNETETSDAPPANVTLLAGQSLCARDLWARRPRPVPLAGGDGAVPASLSLPVAPHGAQALLVWLAEAGADCASGAQTMLSD